MDADDLSLDPRVCHQGSGSSSQSRLPLGSDRSAEKMLGPGGPEPSGGPPLKASSQSKESVRALGEGDRELVGDGSEEEKTEEKPSESGEGDSRSNEPGKSKGTGGSRSSGSTWSSRMSSMLRFGSSCALRIASCSSSSRVRLAGGVGKGAGAGAGTGAGVGVGAKAGEGVGAGTEAGAGAAPRGSVAPENFSLRFVALAFT